MEAGIRRGPSRPAPDLSPNPALAALIEAEIRRTGPISFARFMELALYAPDLGYYTSPEARIGRGGDFLTAPETHPIFGAAIARQIEGVWRRLGGPGDFTVREYGAGTGALAESILAAVGANHPDLAPAVRYEAVEINPWRREDMVRRLGPKVAPGRFAALAPDDAVRPPPATSVPAGFVIANEFLDAFPVHRVRQTDVGLREVFVDATSDGFVERLGPPSTPLIAERLAREGITLEPGQQAEFAFGLKPWFAGVGAWLTSGVVLVIDYGAPAAELYAARHRAGTLLGYIGHEAIDDPFAAVGRQDLTAHVDLTAVEQAAADAGFSVLGQTTQARFLIDLGLEDLLEQARSDSALGLGDYVELRSGLARLIDPRHTGGFAVGVFGRGLPDGPPLRGLQRPGG